MKMTRMRVSSMIRRTTAIVMVILTGSLANIEALTRPPAMVSIAMAIIDDRIELMSGIKMVET